MRYLSTIIIAAMVGAPLTAFAVAFAQGIAHAGWGKLLGLLFAPGFVAGLLPVTNGIFWAVFILIQVVYYILVAFALKWAFRRIFLESSTDAS